MKNYTGLCPYLESHSLNINRKAVFRTLRVDKKETYCMSNNFSRDSYGFPYHLTIISTRAIIFMLRVYILSPSPPPLAGCS